MGYGLLSASPVIKNGKVLGALVVGFDLDSMASDGYVSIVHNHHSVECTIFKGNVRVATTLGIQMIGTELSNQEIVQKVLYDGEKYVGPNVIVDQKYTTVYIPLISDDGTITGMAFVAKSMRVVDAVRNKTVSVVVPVAVILFLVLATIGYFFVRWIMKRIKNVTVFLGELAS